jgi:hypothetical protein
MAGLQDIRGAADGIQRAPTDERTLEVVVEQLAPTMTALMEKTAQRFAKN